MFQARKFADILTMDTVNLTTKGATTTIQQKTVQEPFVTEEIAMEDIQKSENFSNTIRSVGMKIIVFINMSKKVIRKKTTIKTNTWKIGL